MAKKKSASKKAKKSKSSTARKSRPIIQKDHPWRECPIDHHWVNPQIKRREPSKKHPDGIVPYREPNLAIAGGVRWLFQKRAEAKAKLRKEPTWTETIIFYKGYANDYLKKTPIERMTGLNVFREAYQRLTGKEFGQ